MIIGLSGYARSGKDTVAEHLVRKHGFKRVSFADEMRDALWILNPYVSASGFRLIDVVSEYGWDKAKVIFPEIRRQLQVLGSEIGRKWNENFWIELAFSKINLDEDTVITDVRFLNEASAVVQAGGEVWRVNRPETGPVNAHQSETDLDWYLFKQVIDNDSDIFDLNLKIDEILRLSK